jgi:hypothetical protein
MQAPRLTFKESLDLALTYCKELQAKGVSTFIPGQMAKDTGIRESAMGIILQGIAKVRIHNVVLCNVDSLLRKYR